MNTKILTFGGMIVGMFGVVLGITGDMCSMWSLIGCGEVLLIISASIKEQP